MDWFDDPKVWMAMAAVVALAGLMIYFMARKRSKPATKSTPPPPPEDKVTELGEDFGMYESAFANWLDTHTEQPINRPARREKQQNQATTTEYMEHDDQYRFKTARPLSTPPSTTVDRQKYLTALYQVYRGNN